MAEICWVEGWISKAKWLWECPLKVSGPFDHFRIEGQNFTGCCSISQSFFIGFGRKNLIVPTVNLYCTHRAYKNSLAIDQKVLKTK